MWSLFAVAAAFFAALERTLMKGAVDVASDRVIVFTRYGVAALIAVVMLFFVDIPTVHPMFYPSAFLGCFADVTAIVFMSRALRLSQMSRVVPLLSFTPVFLLLTGFVILGELPSLIGVVGVVIVVIGSYLFHVESSRQSIWLPFRMMFQDKGARYMVGTAFGFSLAIPLFKNAILNSSALFTLGVTLSFSTTLLLIYHLIVRKRPLKDILPGKQSRKILIGLGVTVFCVALSVNLAFTTGLVSYVVSIKRLSILLNIVIGFVFFQEQHLFRNLSAGSIMLVGALLILLH